MAAAIQNTANALFMPWVVAVLLGTGVYLTVRLRFVQFRLFREAVRAMLVRQAPGAGGVLTPFQAFMTALGDLGRNRQHRRRRDGDHLRRAGTLFWIWVYGLVATAIKFSEPCSRSSFGASMPPACSPGRCTTCATGSSRRRSHGAMRCSPASAL
jgi:AGCS family alanine or glycine:cation symporter